MRQVINITETGSRTFYHGTKADLKPRDMLQMKDFIADKEPIDD